MAKKPRTSNAAPSQHTKGPSDPFYRYQEAVGIAYGALTFVAKLSMLFIPTGLVFGAFWAVFSFVNYMTPSEVTLRAAKKAAEDRVELMAADLQKQIEDRNNELRNYMIERNRDSENLAAKIIQHEQTISNHATWMKSQLDSNLAATSQVVANIKNKEIQTQELFNSLTEKTRRTSGEIQGLMENVASEVAANKQFKTLSEQADVAQSAVVDSIADNILARQEFKEIFWRTMAPAGTIIMATSDDVCPDGFSLVGRLELFSVGATDNTSNTNSPDSATKKTGVCIKS